VWEWGIIWTYFVLFWAEKSVQVCESISPNKDLSTSSTVSSRDLGFSSYFGLSSCFGFSSYFGLSSCFGLASYFVSVSFVSVLTSLLTGDESFLINVFYYGCESYFWRGYDSYFFTIGVLNVALSNHAFCPSDGSSIVVSIISLNS
jgi:hypothetical protein